MKNLVKPAAVIVALMMVSFYQPAKASGGPHSWFSSVSSYLYDENKFSFQLSREGSEEIISLQIQNPGKKNLSVSLNGPDGTTVDNFFTGRKFMKISKQYNFSGADEGLYTIVISDGVEKIKRQVKLERVLAKPVSVLVVQ